MKTSSAKAKGRRLQQMVRDSLRAIGKKFNIVDGDIESLGMGQNGVDLILSPAALKVFDLSIECKNVETLNVHGEFWKHYEKYKDNESQKLLVHTKNRFDPLVTMRLTDFIRLLEKSISQTK